MHVQGMFAVGYRDLLLEVAGFNPRRRFWEEWRDYHKLGVMRISPLPTEVQDLIASLDSMDQLEVLLLLLQSPSRVFHSHEIAHTLNLTSAAAEVAANALHRRRLIASIRNHPQQPAYQYAPDTIKLHAAAEELGTAWSTQTVAITKLLYDRPNNTLRTFTEAFRLRRRDTI